MTNKKQKKIAVVDLNSCVACGACVNICPKKAIKIFKGTYAVVNNTLCIGCGLCKKECPASVITMEVANNENHEN